MLFEIQNGKENYTEPSLLFYYRGISTCLFANQYTYLGIMNGVKAIIYRVVFYLNN